LVLFLLPPVGMLPSWLAGRPLAGLEAAGAGAAADPPGVLAAPLLLLSLPQALKANARTSKATSAKAPEWNGWINRFMVSFLSWLIAVNAVPQLPKGCLTTAWLPGSAARKALRRLGIFMVVAVTPDVVGVVRLFGAELGKRFHNGRVQ
jgi:hypothetical protein